MFSLDENQISNKTKRNSTLFCTQTWSISRINSFFVTGSFVLVRLEIAIPNWFFDDLERHRNGNVINMVQTVEKIEALYCPTFAVVIMPTHHFIFVGIGLFLNRVFEYQYPVFPFHFSYCRFDFQL